MRDRRFAEVFQFDFFFRGSDVQRQAVVEAMTPQFGTPHHQLVKRLDRQVNSGIAADGVLYHKRSSVTIGFHSGMTAPGHASPAGFNLSAAMGWNGCYEVARHEFGHLIDFWVINEGVRAWFMAEMGRGTWPGAHESWAEAVREWLDGGWPALTPMLLPDN